MEKKRRDILLLELETQVKFALMSFDGLQNILIKMDNKEDIDISPFWYYCQNLIIYSGNLSKILWGVRSNNKLVNETRMKERCELRFLLSVKENSPIKNRSLRNALEHADEKLEAFSNNERNIVIDKYFGPPRNLISFDDDSIYDASKEKNLRYYNPETRVFYFYGTKTNIERLVQEIKKLQEDIGVVKQEQNF